MLSGKKAEHFKQLLETRSAELNRMLAAAEQETRARAARHADPADQAAAEYERQSIVHKSNTARQMLKTLTQALERIQHGNFGECAECSGDIEPKRLEGDSVGALLRRVSGSKGAGLMFGDSTGPLLFALPHQFRFPEGEPRQHADAHQHNADSR